MANIFVFDPKDIKGVKGVQDKNNSDEDKEKNTFRIIFKEKDETTKIIFVNPEYSVGSAIKKYLIQTERAESIHRISENNNLMVFIFHGKKIDINDKMKVKEFFGINDQIVYAIDTSDILGA